MSSVEIGRPALTTVARASIILGVSERTAWRLIGKGLLPTVTIGCRRLVRLADLDEMVSRRADSTTRVNTRSVAQ